MKALALLIATYATLGAVLAFANSGTPLGVIATITGVSVAFVLGLLWPVHRNFPIAGVIIGGTIALFVLLLVLLLVVLPPGEYRDVMTVRERADVAMRGLALSTAMLATWASIMATGAAAAWLARFVSHKNAEGQA